MSIGPLIAHLIFRGPRHTALLRGSPRIAAVRSKILGFAASRGGENHPQKIAERPGWVVGLRTLMACNAENDSDLSSRNEGGRPPPNLPLVRGRDFRRYRFQCYRTLVYFKMFADPVTAINREKQIERWSRGKKLALIRTANPSFKELSLDESA